MTPQDLQAQQRFLLRQRVRLTVNQYEVHLTNPDGSEGPLVAFAQQKRLALKEQVTLYTDDTKQQPVLSFKARQVIDLGATYDVMDETGRAIGLFRKDFKKSLLRTTYHLESGLGTATGQERSMAVAMVRRFLAAWPYHFDFVMNGQPVFSVVKKWGLRDRYVIEIQDPRIDRRLVIAMAVALDALQKR